MGLPIPDNNSQKSSNSLNLINDEKYNLASVSDGDLNFDDDELVFKDSIATNNTKPSDLMLDGDLVFRELDVNKSKKPFEDMVLDEFNLEESSIGKTYDYNLDDLKLEESQVRNTGEQEMDDFMIKGTKTQSMFQNEFDLKIDESPMRPGNKENEDNFDPNLSQYDDKLLCKIINL